MTNRRNRARGIALARNLGRDGIAERIRANCLRAPEVLSTRNDGPPRGFDRLLGAALAEHEARELAPGVVAFREVERRCLEAIRIVRAAMAESAASREASAGLARAHLRWAEAALVEVTDAAQAVEAERARLADKRQR